MMTINCSGALGVSRHREFHKESVIRVLEDRGRRDDATIENRLKASHVTARRSPFRAKKWKEVRITHSYSGILARRAGYGYGVVNMNNNRASWTRSENGQRRIVHQVTGTEKLEETCAIARIWELSVMSWRCCDGILGPKGYLSGYV